MKKPLLNGLQILSAIAITGSIAIAMATGPSAQPSNEQVAVSEVKEISPPVNSPEPAEQPKPAEPVVVPPEPQTAPVEAPVAPQAQVQVQAEPEPAPLTGNYLIWLQQSGIPQQYWRVIDFIIIEESSWRVDAVNSIGCIGLGQSCPGGSGLANDCPDWQTNPVCQLQHFDRYASSRYGGWGPAYQFWLQNNWW